jgi:hypothetical protein
MLFSEAEFQQPKCTTRQRYFATVDHGDQTPANTLALPAETDKSSLLLEPSGVHCNSFDSAIICMSCKIGSLSESRNLNQD